MNAKLGKCVADKLARIATCGGEGRRVFAHEVIPRKLTMMGKRLAFDFSLIPFMFFVSRFFSGFAFLCGFMLVYCRRQ